MHKFINNTWLKNVNNLRNTVSKTIVQPSTIQPLTLHKQPTNWSQTQLNKLFTAPLSTKLFTAQKHIFYLLNKSFTFNPPCLLLRLINEI